MTNTNKNATGARNDFDFEAYNTILSPNGRKIPAGLQIALAEGLLNDALYSMERFHNPLADDMKGIGLELRTFRVKWKEAAALRNAAAEKAKGDTPNPQVEQREEKVDTAVEEETA